MDGGTLLNGRPGDTLDRNVLDGDPLSGDTFARDAFLGVLAIWQRLSGFLVGTVLPGMLLRRHFCEDAFKMLTF